MKLPAAAKLHISSKPAAGAADEPAGGEAPAAAAEPAAEPAAEQAVPAPAAEEPAAAAEAAAAEATAGDPAAAEQAQQGGGDKALDSQQRHEAANTRFMAQAKEELRDAATLAQFEGMEYGCCIATLRCGGVYVGVGRLVVQWLVAW